jgi:ribosomal protein L40E
MKQKKKTIVFLCIIFVSIAFIVTGLFLVVKAANGYFGILDLMLEGESDGDELLPQMKKIGFAFIFLFIGMIALVVSLGQLLKRKKQTTTIPFQEMRIICKNCGSENLANASFCKKCGKPLFRICSNCQTKNPIDNNYCSECGQKL